MCGCVYECVSCVCVWGGEPGSQSSERHPVNECSGGVGGDDKQLHPTCCFPTMPCLVCLYCTSTIVVLFRIHGPLSPPQSSTTKYDYYTTLLSFGV